jgi:hypothetical protein
MWRIVPRGRSSFVTAVSCFISLASIRGWFGRGYGELRLQPKGTLEAIKMPRRRFFPEWLCERQADGLPRQFDREAAEAALIALPA